MKIAIVTGASSGMGREAAIQLADRFAGLDSQKRGTSEGAETAASCSLQDI